MGMVSIGSYAVYLATGGVARCCRHDGSGPFLDRDVIYLTFVLSAVLGLWPRMLPTAGGSSRGEADPRHQFHPPAPV
jgi:hypothetical protein